MGSIVSKTHIFFQAIAQLKRTYDLFHKRIEASPGLPVPNPTLPFWTVPPAALPASDKLPEYADVVIIGSGITGTSVAYNILAQESNLKIVILEAREVCSGATGRNGGHVNPPLYHDYTELKDKFGEHTARVMVAFRRAHLTELLRIAAEEDILNESQCRETEHIDVFTCPKTFAKAKDNLARWRAAMPAEASSFVCYKRVEAIEKYHLSDQVQGCIANAGGAMHPYRFVTSLLAILLARHPDSLQIFAHTPCTALTSGRGGYTAHTPRGPVRAAHVVHATNGWCTHLLPHFRTRIAPARGAMSAQRPGTGPAFSSPGTAAGARSYVFYRAGETYDYLTQLPAPGGEMMFGGGWAQAAEHGLPEIGVADDAWVNEATTSYLGGALPLYFGLHNWGAEARPEGDEDGEKWAEGRMKARWSGILGISADLLPWVGRIPEKLAGRAVPTVSERGAPSNEKVQDEEGERAQLAAPGEWIAAGYSGEGMVHAWMSGNALAHMLLDKGDEVREWFPDILRVSEKRWKEASFDDLIAKFM
ncbi:FAD dependent oxidoreductase [Trametes elegans]|nr:FAD dependent oxidoreductase [Trametes elegans]